METQTSPMVQNLSHEYFRTVPNGSFRISSLKKSKTIEFFEDLYKYPPKFRVKWNTIDDLHDDLFMFYNYRTISQNSPFLDASDSIFQNDDVNTVTKTKYSINSYLNGYLNKITSTKLYNKTARNLKESLQNIPVYAVLNEQGEIVLATSTDSKIENSTTLNKVAYDFCGNFDPVIERVSKLGLFFMDKRDAEVYLNSIAKSDTQGTKMFGLSIHCFGLDFAYRVTREQHPDIDFRFVPNLEEIQTLLKPRTTEDANLIFEDGQQQLRMRKRAINILPVFNGLNKWISPFASFLEKTEYFKGVPIYIIQVNNVPQGFFANNSQRVINLMDSFFGSIGTYLSKGIGFGNNWIMQGSSKQNLKEDAKTYIFFSKDEALTFCKVHEKKIRRYNGSHSSIFQSITKKPKIIVHNLEDFLELLEENLVEVESTTQSFKLDPNKVSFIPTERSAIDIENSLKDINRSSFGKILQFFDFKYRRLTGFIGLILNTN